MDRSLYVAMTGATQMMREQSEVAHNLANADTVGFKAQLSAFKPLEVLGPGLASRINGVAYAQGVDVREGGQIVTGRELDVAVQGRAGSRCRVPTAAKPIPGPAVCNSPRMVC